MAFWLALQCVWVCLVPEHADWVDFVNLRRTKFWDAGTTALTSTRKYPVWRGGVNVHGSGVGTWSEFMLCCGKTVKIFLSLVNWVEVLWFYGILYECIFKCRAWVRGYYDASDISNRWQRHRSLHTCCRRWNCCMKFKPFHQQNWAFK